MAWDLMCFEVKDSKKFKNEDTLSTPFFSLSFNIIDKTKKPEHGTLEWRRNDASETQRFPWKRSLSHFHNSQGKSK